MGFWRSDADSCCPWRCPDPCAQADPPCCTARCNTIGEDYGPGPFAVDLEKATLKNPYFRRAIWTGPHLQLTLMCIAPGGEVGLEMHDNLDQFLRIEEGEGRVMMGSSQNNLSYQKNVSAGFAIFVPAGTWHNLVNTSCEPIKLYSIYAPVQHPPGTIHCTKADSDAAHDNG